MSDPTQTLPAFQRPELLARGIGKFLEEQIVYGELQPRTRLVEEALVQQYGVSRSPLREAFRELEQHGLVVRESRKGVFVSPTSRKDLDEVYGCRMPLEGLAAEEAAKHRTDADIARLRALLADLQAAHAAQSVREYFQHNVRMSEQIALTAGNATLGRLLGLLGKQALRYRYMVYSRFTGMMDVSFEGNSVIVEAIARQNARHARSLTEDLILRSWRSIGRYLAEQEGAPVPPTSV